GVVEGLGVHPVLVLLAHPLVRPAGARVVVVGLTDDVALIVGLAAHGQAEDVGVSALHDDAVAAGGQLHESGRPIAPRFWYAWRPSLGRNLDVPIAGDYVVFASHGRTRSEEHTS